MSVEALWYSMYSAGGKAPHCVRLSRMPMTEQWNAAIDLAISFTTGEAGYRQVFISRTREQYWYWPDARSKSGWWLIPERVAQRAFALEHAACNQVFHVNHGCADQEQVAAVLRQWKRTGAWRGHVAHIVPRRALIKPVIQPKRKRGGQIDMLAVRTRAAQIRSQLGLYSQPETTARAGATYKPSATRGLDLPAGYLWAECDEAHCWIIPNAQHNEALDRCPMCGEYWV